MSKETVASKRINRTMKPIIKAPKMLLDHHKHPKTVPSSSESGSEDDMHGLRYEFGGNDQVVTVPSDAPYRTIKVINADTMNDNDPSSLRIHRLGRKQHQLQRDPLMAKGLQRYILSLSFDDIDERSLNEATALQDTFASCKEYSRHL